MVSSPRSWHTLLPESLTNMDKLKAILALLKQVLSLQIRLNATQPTSLQPLVARKAQELITAMAAHNLPVTINEGFRTRERQDRLYAQGRTTPGNIVTNARAGDSLHNYGVAVDMVFVDYGYNATETQWQQLGQVAESIGFEWGGRWASFPDRPHCQFMLGYTLADFKAGNVDYDKYK